MAAAVLVGCVATQLTIDQITVFRSVFRGSREITSKEGEDEKVLLLLCARHKKCHVCMGIKEFFFLVCG